MRLYYYCKEKSAKKNKDLTGVMSETCNKIKQSTIKITPGKQSVLVKYDGSSKNDTAVDNLILTKSSFNFNGQTDIDDKNSQMEEEKEPSKYSENKDDELSIDVIKSNEQMLNNESEVITKSLTLGISKANVNIREESKSESDRQQKVYRPQEIVGSQIFNKSKSNYNLEIVDDPQMIIKSQVLPSEVTVNDKHKMANKLPDRKSVV